MSKMTEKLDRTDLPAYQPRCFVPDKADLRRKEDVVGLYEQLLARDVRSSAELEQWILDRSELEAALSQEESVLYIRMTCQTDNSAFVDEYKSFIENVSPEMGRMDDKLNHRYVGLKKQFFLDDQRYRVYDREMQADIDLFREENVDLKTQVDLLSQEYQTVCGAMTVEFQGKEMTLPQMSKFLYEPDREVRESAWRKTADRRLQDKDKLDELFDQMMQLRNRMAANAGCRDFCEYQFRRFHRFDYTSGDCRQYHKAVEQCVVPVWGKMLERRRNEMKLKSLRPWDLAADPLGRPPLKPFQYVRQLTEGVEKIFTRVDPQLGAQFHDMAEAGLLDLDNRKGKAPGGYQSALDEVRRPFIFMNAVGVDDDVRTLLHEGGHAFHCLACVREPLVDYRHGPMEFNEVASMSMELLGGEYMDEFYDSQDFERSKQSHLEGVIHILAWVATVDAFQYWIYEHPGHSRAERNRAWMDIHHRFGAKFIDWTGLEESAALLWHRQLHIFEVPFYYIEYGIAQLGALQIWLRAKKDRPDAIKKYREALALGGSRPLPELFSAAGIQFDFSSRTIKPLVDMIQKELGL